MGPLGAATFYNLSDEHVEYQMRDCTSGTMLWRFLEPTSTLPPYRRLRNFARSTVKCNGQIFGVEENLARGLVAEYLSGARVEFVPDPLVEDQHAG